jgi:hypothetical protein
MLLDRGSLGDAERARKLLEKAIEIYQEIGMPRHVELAAQLLERS